MNETWEEIKTWFLSLGEQYGVDPVIFGSIYVGAIPFFSLSIAWLVRNYRKGKSLTFPLLSAGFFFISAYLYLFFVGKNIAWWVYVFILALLSYFAWGTYKNTRKKLSKSSSQKEKKQ